MPWHMLVFVLQSAFLYESYNAKVNAKFNARVNAGVKMRSIWTLSQNFNV